MKISPEMVPLNIKTRSYLSDLGKGNFGRLIEAESNSMIDE